MVSELPLRSQAELDLQKGNKSAKASAEGKGNQATKKKSRAKRLS
jgi:hypothetical protein